MRKQNFYTKTGSRKNSTGRKPGTSSSRPARPFKRKEGDEKENPDSKPRFSPKGKRPFRPRESGEGDSRRENKDTAGREPFKPRFSPKGRKPFLPKESAEGGDERKKENKYVPKKEFYKPRYTKSRKRHSPPEKPSNEEVTGQIRLNKYIANAGISSRREADNLIRSGVVTVNGTTITEMGYKVKPGDIVRYEKQAISPEKKVYIVLNKPRDYITTTDDPLDRKHVMQLLHNVGKERLFPVGRLDRNTTGVLLFTNDGELTKKLTHPKYGVKKIYHISLDKALTVPDLHAISNGVELEDGFIKADEISYAGDGSDKKEIGIEIHSGRNRIIRRLFEQLGYTVKKLDRVSFAGITKKDVTRGKWRFLSEKEVGFLNMIKQQGPNTK